MEQGQTRGFELTSSVRVGRHWSNDARLDSESVPMSWLELRWRGAGWGWRVLSAGDRTRGSGSAGDEGWRVWNGGSGHVRLDGGAAPVEVRLHDPSAPQVVVERLTRPARFTGAKLERFVESWSDGRVWPLGVEPTEAPPLRDGEVFVLEQDAFRLYLPRSVFDTVRVSIDLRHPALELTVDLARLHASLSVGGCEAVATGECVRVLAVYARIRREDGDLGGGGWIPTPAAHGEWVGLGGRAGSPLDRLAWERGKLRTQLARQGVSSLDTLFELRRSAGFPEVRLSLAPAQLAVIDS